VVLRAGHLANIRSVVWLSSITELYARLPLRLDESLMKSMGPSDRALYGESCNRCCGIILELWIAQYVEVLGEEGGGRAWLLFVVTLANNLNVTPRTSQIHDDLLEMIATLLMLLLPNADRLIGLPISPNGSSPRGAMLRLANDSWTSLISVCKFAAADLKTQHPDLVADLLETLTP
jgi:hypothetical protein